MNNAHSSKFSISLPSCTANYVAADPISQVQSVKVHRFESNTPDRSSEIFLISNTRSSSSPNVVKAGVVVFFITIFDRRSCSSIEAMKPFFGFFHLFLPTKNNERKSKPVILLLQYLFFLLLKILPKFGRGRKFSLKTFRLIRHELEGICMENGEERKKDR